MAESLALAVGGWFASAIIRKVLDNANSYIGGNDDLHTRTREMLTQLETQLPHIRSVIEAAEKRQIINRDLERLLEQLKDAAHEADDVLDDFEAKRIHKSTKGYVTVSEIDLCIQIVKTVISSGKDLKRLEFVVDKLDKVCMHVGTITENFQLTHSDNREEHGDNLGREKRFHSAPTVFGRENETKLILNRILNVHGESNLHEGEGSSSGAIRRAPMFSKILRQGYAPEPHVINNWKPAVIPIVGVGGVGKTAVAAWIYHNERVEEHFSSRAWVSVSENCDAKNVMRNILFSIEDGVIDAGNVMRKKLLLPFEHGFLERMTLEFIESKIKETIRYHRFLLILDDLRDRTKHIWSKLIHVLNYGKIGSVVVVTTQSTDIANTVRTLPEVNLNFLQQESFWKLFQYYAFGNDQSKQKEFEDIGKLIAGKLNGLPLAGKVIGTLLSTRYEREFWNDICKSNWWDINYARENILPSIVVGYNYLDPELKQCFLFCSIFPKHYVFERERLVEMWIAQGFIEPNKEETSLLDNGETRLEDIGRKWFDQLVDRSFFQTSRDGKYLMRDQMWDLANAVSLNEFCFVESHDKIIPPSTRHLGIYCENLEVEWKCEDSKKLRTVILFGNLTNCSDKSISNIFAKYNGSRVLDLSYIPLEKNTPINGVCQLSHLRFLNLSFTGINWIPDEFCALCHLQMLDVRGCNFKRLPKGMNQLINLRHLYASSDTISLISSIGKLTKLQELEEFRIGKHKGHRISELMDMNEISEHLLLKNLNNVSSKQEAAKSQLDKKKYLKSLELRFEYNDHGSRTKVKMEVLDALKPACTLEILKVGGCRWESFPNWVSPNHGFNNLKVIHLYCFWLSNLPAFGELHSLELLRFDDLPLIQKVGSEFYGSSDVAFQSLKELTFSRMSLWRDWSGAEAGKMIFPELKKLHLDECSVLKELPQGSFTSPVVELILSQCSDLCNIQTVLQGMPYLAHLNITDSCNSLSLNCITLKFLEAMHLTGIKQLSFIGGSKSLVNLRKLVIVGFDEILVSWLDEFLESYEVDQENDEISQGENEKQCLQFLTYLHLRHNKDSTQSLPRVGRLSSLRTLLIRNSPAVEYTIVEERWFNQLTSLENLEFRDCLKLSCLPSELQLITSLKKLHIYSCPCLFSLPENGLPKDLAELYIVECPDLIRRCQRNKGDDWHKISHIPTIHLEE